MASPLKVVEAPSQEFIEEVSKEHGRIKFRVVDLDLRAAPLPTPPPVGRGSVIVVAIKEGEGIGVVRDSSNEALHSFPMGPLGNDDLPTAVRRIGREELGAEVRVYKVPAVHVARYHHRDGILERWNFLTVGKVEALISRGKGRGGDIKFVADPMSLPHWKESDWHFWILRDAELHV
jgi:hypothetical protein